MFGERLKMIRKQCGLTQKSLANELFVSQQSVWKWEKNESSPNPETIAKMAQIFGVTADYLLGQEKEKPASGETDGLSEEERELIRLYGRASLETQAAALGMLRAAEAARATPDDERGDK